MAESGGLENRWAFTRPVGSNPTPSATILISWIKSILSCTDCVQFSYLIQFCFDVLISISGFRLNSGRINCIFLSCP